MPRIIHYTAQKQSIAILIPECDYGADEISELLQGVGGFLRGFSLAVDYAHHLPCNHSEAFRGVVDYISIRHGQNHNGLKPGSGTPSTRSFAREAATISEPALNSRFAGLPSLLFRLLWNKPFLRKWINYLHVRMDHPIAHVFRPQFPASVEMRRRDEKGVVKLDAILPFYRQCLKRELPSAEYTNMLESRNITPTPPRRHPDD